jgi:ABC-2 type transport system permease protein
VRLIGVELSRFFSRRAVVLLLVAAALMTAVIAGTTIWNTRPVSGNDLAAARAQVQQQIDSSDFKQDLASCRRDPESVFGPDGDAADCRGQLTPTPASFVGRSTLSLRDEQGTGGTGVVVIITLLMILVGATFAGADWSSGSLSNQMLFETRRGRVWVAKAVAVTAGCAAASVVLLVGYWLSLLSVAQSRGIGTSGAVQESISEMAGRGALLATLAGLGAYALTMLLRSTVAALAVVFVFVVAGEVTLAVSPLDRSQLWSPTNNVFAWLQDGVRVFDDRVGCAPGLTPCTQDYTVSLLHGAAYLAVLLLATLALSVLTFRRRDIP